MQFVSNDEVFRHFVPHETADNHTCANNGLVVVYFDGEPELYVYDAKKQPGALAELTRYYARDWAKTGRHVITCHWFGVPRIEGLIVN